MPWRMSDETWRARCSVAADRLSDARAMLRLGEVVRGAAERGERVAEVEAGGRMAGGGRVGVFTGSFNPLTWAHVAVAETARDALRLDTLVWACSRVTVDKEGVERATLVDRLAQVDALARAEEHGDRVAVLDAGLYVAQARALRSTLAPEATLTLIVGFDKIVQILDPRYYEDRDASLRELFALAELRVAPRGGDDVRALDDLLRTPANQPFAPAIHYLPVPVEVAALSSTSVRARAGACDEGSAFALADVAPPEGAALACATGAYRAGQPSNGAQDAYAWRQRWLEALAQGPLPGEERLDLRRLAAVTQERSARGDAARRWLTEERGAGGPEALAALLRDVLA